jgi:signal transduction histidine kinase
MTWRTQDLVFAPLRVLPLLVTVAYLAVLHGPTEVTATDWVLGVLVAALAGLALWLPLAASVAQSALLAFGLAAGPRTVMPMLFLLTMVTLGELWVRRDDWRCWTGAAAFVVAQVVLLAPHFDVLLSTSSIVVTTLPPVGLGVYMRSVLRRAWAAERGRERSVREARAAERTAIARELHDLVAHHMASIAVQVGAARHTLGGANTAVDEALSQAHTTTRAALTDMKRLMAVLRDPATVSDDVAGTALAEPEGLVTALASAVAQVRAAGVTVDSEVDEGVVGLDSIRRLAVLRVVQEGLTNVVKHAGRDAHATLTVRVSGQAVRVVVADDGPGGRPGRHGGFGLVGMRERVELLGGAVRVLTDCPGWTVEVVIP